MKLTKQEILTPANVITLAGLIITLIGSLWFNTLIGFLIVIIGRLLDILDGMVARRTKVTKLGAMLDAISDKLTGLSLLISSYYYELAPHYFILFVLLQHLSVSLISLLTMLRKGQLRVIRLGKRNMFLHITTLLLFSVSYQITDSGGQNLRNGANILAIGGMLLGIVTTLAYLKLYVDMIRNPK